MRLNKPELLRFNLADVESRLGVSTQQLSGVRKELTNSKTLLSDTQLALSTIQEESAIKKQKHLVAHWQLHDSLHLLITQRALSDWHSVPLNANSAEAEYLRNDRVNILHALNTVSETMDQLFPAFDPVRTDSFLPSNHSLRLFSRAYMPTQHIRAVEEHDKYISANKEYAEDLRTLCSEHLASFQRIRSLMPLFNGFEG